MLPKLLILFAKCPIPGRVKTRLCPPLTPHQAAELHRALVRDTIERFDSFAGHKFELHTDTQCVDVWPEMNVARKLQESGDLGLKMLHALHMGLRNGHPRVTIIGSDAPDLPPDLLSEVAQSDADVAFGPALDGGYYAISAARVHPKMFAGVHWSTSSALTDSENACHRAGLSTSRGGSWHDIDEPADLQRLFEHPEAVPPRTQSWMQRFGRSTAVNPSVR